MNKKFIVYGYLASWKNPDGWSLDKIDWHALTHIVDSFGLPDEYGDIDMTKTRNRELVNFAHKKNVFCNLSLGGAKNSHNFSKIASDAKLKKKFINNILKIMNEYGYDGIDIDWEFPERKDKINFTLFMKELYYELKNFNKNNILTFFTTTGIYDDSVEWEKISDFCDYAIQSGYDWNNPYNAPLKNTGEIKTKAGEKIENSIDGFAESIIKRGFNYEKLILGLPFYSRPSGIYYGNIKNSKFLRYDKLQEEAVYKYNNKEEYINTAESFTSKINYVKKQKRPGIAIWEVSMIYPEYDLWDEIKKQK